MDVTIRREYNMQPQEDDVTPRRPRTKRPPPRVVDALALESPLNSDDDTQPTYVPVPLVQMGLFARKNESDYGSGTYNIDNNVNIIVIDDGSDDDDQQHDSVAVNSKSPIIIDDDSNNRLDDMDMNSKRYTEDDTSTQVDTSSDDDDSRDYTTANEDNENESTNDDRDLDDLLTRAKSALQTRQICTTSTRNRTDYETTERSLPKLQPGVVVNDELYIQAKKDGTAALTPHSVTITGVDEPVSYKALMTLKRITQEIRSLTRKERQQKQIETTGKGWFDMPRATETLDTNRDLQILKMRHILDPKRHYQKMTKNPDPKYFQRGTIMEGASEFFSSRINKRRLTFAEELLVNDRHVAYYKRSCLESQERRSSGGEKYSKIKVHRY